MCLLTAEVEDARVACSRTAVNTSSWGLEFSDASPSIRAHIVGRSAVYAEGPIEREMAGCSPEDADISPRNTPTTYCLTRCSCALAIRSVLSDGFLVVEREPAAVLVGLTVASESPSMRTDANSQKIRLRDWKASSTCHPCGSARSDTFLKIGPTLMSRFVVLGQSTWKGK